MKSKFIKEGEKYFSKFDRGFNIQDRDYQDQNILYIGNSITYGSPYKGASTKRVFSYPWRVQQLTGAKMYNPSIPGATYAYKDSLDRDRMVKQVAEPISKGETPYAVDKNLDFGDNGHNTQTYKDFDVVVMACGTNDYSDNVEFGSLDSTDITQFNGAVNQIMAWIKEGSDQRVAEGKAPIKIVFVDLFYSDRTQIYHELHNRFVTENGIGLTLTDYQANLDALTAHYRDQGFEIYEFDTSSFATESTCPYVTSDNLHMSRFTYGQVGNSLARFMVDNGILQ